jgi:hypothetical protein
MVFGTDEFNISDREFVDLYQTKLTPTERKYFDAWSKWHRFKIQPWRFLNQKIITRDLLLAIEQIDNLYKHRMAIKEHKDKIAKEQGAFRPFQASQQQRSNKAKSVL